MSKKINQTCKKIEGRPSINRYLASIENLPSGLSMEEECRLAKLVKKGDVEATNKLITANLRFVISVAKEYQGQGIELDDLIAEGNLGLLKAADRFDHTRGFKFISYAVWWIRQSILQAIAEQARVVKLPLNKVGDMNRIHRAMERMDQQLGRCATFDEIARDVNKHKTPACYEIDETDVRMTLVQTALPISLDEPFHDEADSNSLYDVLEGNTFEHPGDSLDRQSMKDEIRQALGTLKPREADIIRMYFGLDGDRPMTLQELGEHFKLTRERVRQIKEKALRRLRHKTRIEPLRKYLA